MDRKKINIIVAIIIIFSSIILFLFVLQVNKEHVLKTNDGQIEESKDVIKNDLQELNKNLPEGMRVIENSGKQYVVNNTDGYEIAVPEKWELPISVDYRQADDHKSDWVNIEGNKGEILEIRAHELGQKENDLSDWVRTYVNNLQGSRFTYFPNILGEENISNYQVMKVRDDDQNVGIYYFYFFKKNSKIYEISSDYSEESIRDVVLNSNFDS